MQNGLCWPSRWACLWVLVLCICFCFALPINAQENIVSEQSRLIESLRLRLETISVLAMNLESESQNWKMLSQENEQLAQGLLNELAVLRQELENSQADSEASLRLVAELKASQAQSESKLQALLSTWKRSAELWKEAADASDLRLRKQKARTVLYVILAAILGGLTGWAVK